MVKFLKPGKVVVILSGRFAGKKAVIVKLDEEANGEQKKYHSCTVVGIERYPRRVYRGMSEKTIKRRCSMKPFIKSINLTHIMPTRYLSPALSHCLVTTSISRSSFPRTLPSLLTRRKSPRRPSASSSRPCMSPLPAALCSVATSIRPTSSLRRASRVVLTSSRSSVSKQFILCRDCRI